MTRRQHLSLPPSPPPRNPLATAAKMRRGVEIHEKSRGALRRGLHMKLSQAVKGNYSVLDTLED
ncbi:MAG: hypothetical protein LBJ59_05320 [Zoogloeaceae bacterium]|jgi:hypothetical protein|nr:hypothetical protein [Zoogloeaceae bacterium]